MSGQQLRLLAHGQYNNMATKRIPNNAGLVSVIAAANANTDVTNTTYVNISDLSYVVQAGKQYYYNINIIFGLAGIVSGYKLRPFCTSSTTVTASFAQVINNNSTISKTVVDTSLQEVTGPLAILGKHSCQMTGTFIPDTDGNFGPQIAQNVTNASAITMYAGSSMTLIQI